MINLNKFSGYITFLELNKADKLQLFDYLRFIIEEKDLIFKKIKSSEYSASKVWEDWSKVTFVGFSNSYVLLNSGHRFTKSSEFNNFPAYPTFKNKLSAAVRSVKRLFAISEYNSRIQKQIHNFCKIYGYGWFEQSDKVINKIITTHTSVALRMLEIQEMWHKKPKKINKLLEVGAGAGVNLLLFNRIWGTKTTCIDLPDTIANAYCFIKYILPNAKITLPNEIGKQNNYDADFTFVLPYQIENIGDGFNVGFNASSFGEMEIEVVNKYINIINELLISDGILISCNQWTSRYIKNNSFKNYNLNQFIEQQTSFCPWQNIYTPKNIKQILYIGRKS